MRAAVIQQTAARLAEEQPGTSLESHFQARAVQFEMVSQGEGRRESKCSSSPKETFVCSLCLLAFDLHSTPEGVSQAQTVSIPAKR